MNIYMESVSIILKDLKQLLRFHFLDAQDWQLLRDGQTIQADPFCPA